MPWKEIVKGFEYDKGSYIVLDDKDLAEAAPEGSPVRARIREIARAALP